MTACLRSLSDQLNPPVFELLVGSRHPEAVEAEVREQFPGAVVAGVAGSMPGGGRNLLIEQARGELLLFLDDDVVAHPELLARLARLAAAHPSVGVFGGPNLTPSDSSTFQVVQGAVLGSMVATGPIRRRYGKHPPAAADERSFILCNLAIRRNAMRPFEEELACAEENHLLMELQRQGVEMRYEPELIVYHERRETPGGLARQIYKYGYGRGQVIRRNPSGARLGYLVPSATVVYLGLAPALALWRRWTLLPAGAYALMVGVGGAKVARSMGRRSLALPAGCLIVLVHASYGAGVLAGLRSAPGRPRDRSRAVLDSDARTFETTDI